MSNILVAYFSASGVTAKAAEAIAKAVGGELYEIAPQAPYTNADFNWKDKHLSLIHISMPGTATLTPLGKNPFAPLGLGFPTPHLVGKRLV